MNLILDLIIAGIIAGTVFLGYKRGFVTTAVIAISGIVSLIAALIFTGPVSGMLEGLELGKAATSIIVFALIYIAAKLLLHLAAAVLTKMLDVPVLRSLNRLLGIAAGAVIAFVRVLMFCFFITAAIIAADHFGSDVFADINTADTVLFKFFSQIDIFSFLL